LQIEKIKIGNKPEFNHQLEMLIMYFF